MTIIEFLTARLDEDAIGLALMPEPTQVIDRSFDRQHLQADIEAKRRIMERLWPPDPHDPGECNDCDVLYLLASVYADHPDYREDWKA